MTNKLITMVAVASVGCVALAAPETWFNGGLGSASMAPTGGSWTVPAEGVTTNASYQLVLDEPDTALQFAAANAKLPEGTNLTFTTTANFKYSYDELPAIDQEAKAGIVIYTNRFYVLGKDSNSNNWTKTTIDAGTVDGEKEISVVITNGNNKVFATYTVGGQSFSAEVYVKNDAKTWGTVSYKGCGIVAALAGQYEATTAPGYPIPGKHSIPADKANAWAAENYPGLTEQQLADMLASNAEYQGRTAAESCILGVKTNDVIDAEVLDQTAAKLSFSVNCEPIEGRATFTLKKNGSSVGEAHNSPDFEVDIADGIYTIVANVDGANKEIAVSQEIGVKGTEIVSGKVKYIAAPWDDCSVTELLKKTCCKAGDKIEYYDAAANGYKSWILADGEWKGDAPVLLKKGQAVKYTAAADATLYAVGDVSSATSTEILSGTARWNLVANPNGDLAATDIPLDTAMAQAVVLGDDGVHPTNILRKVKGKVYYKTAWTNSWAEASGDITIKGGFFLKTQSAGSVTWPAAK